MTAAADIDKQALWQVQTYGAINETMPDGTGPEVRWMPGLEVPDSENPHEPWHIASATEIEDLLREEWDYPKDGTSEQQAVAAGSASWMRILREEVAEAFAAETPKALRAELVQIAAVARNWAETIDRRTTP